MFEDSSCVVARSVSHTQRYRLDGPDMVIIDRSSEAEFDLADNADLGSVI